MRLQVEASNLRRIVAIAGLAVRRNAVPILQCIKLTATGGRLVAAGSDLDIWTQAKCEASVSEHGHCCVNLDDFKAVCQRIKGVVSMDLTPHGLQVEATGASLTLPVSGGEFPSVRKPENETEIVDGVAAMATCIPFAAVEETKFHLRGVTFDGDTATGTNGQRFYAVPSSGGTGQIVPSEAAPIIAKIGGRLFVNESTWRIEAEDMAAQGRLIDADPLDWKRHIFDVEPFAKLSADDLISAIELATVGRAAWTVFKGVKGGFEVSGDRFKGAHIESNCAAPCAGDPPSLVAATDIALAILKAFEGREISLSTANNLIMVRPSKGDDFAIFGSLHDARSTLSEAA